MTNKTKYFRLGVFVITSIVLMLLALALVAGPNFFRPKIIIETYFHHSISGLDVGSPVKFRGIPIGEVKEILLSTEAYPKAATALDDKNAFAVVRMELVGRSADFANDELQTYIDEGARIQTQLTGITGSLYLSLDFLDPSKYPANTLKFYWTPEYPYVPSAPSLTNEIVDNVKNFLAELDGKANIKEVISVLTELAKNTNNLLEKLDTESVNELIKNVSNVAKTTDTKLAQLDVDTINQTLTQLNENTAVIMDKVRRAQVEELIKNLSALSANANNMLKSNQYNLHRTISNLSVVTENLTALSRELREDPSILLSRPRGTTHAPITEVSKEKRK